MSFFCVDMMRSDYSTFVICFLLTHSSQLRLIELELTSENEIESHKRSKALSAGNQSFQSQSFSQALATTFHHV